MDENLNKLVDFLRELLVGINWNEAILNIEIQPGMLGLSGWAMLDEHKESLRTKPNENIKTAIRKLHSMTSTNESNKWNRFKLILKKNSEFVTEYIWDHDWQGKIEEENKRIKKLKPDYKVPKWNWELE